MVRAVMLMMWPLAAAASSLRALSASVPSKSALYQEVATQQHLHEVSVVIFIKPHMQG